MIISIIGGTKDFALPQKLRTSFKLGLIKAAASTNAIVITSGTNSGLVKLVGEAFAQSVLEVTLLGITTWSTDIIEGVSINEKFMLNYTMTILVP